MKLIPILILSLALFNFSQAEELKFEHLSINEGLSQSVVLSIFQDRQGFMWFGTENGLNRYDGYKFTVYKHDAQNSNSLSSSYIWSINEGDEGILWVGTDKGLNRFDTLHQTVKRYHHDENNPHSLSHNDVRIVYKDRQGLLWLGTAYGGLNRFDPQTETFTRYQSEENNPTRLSHNEVQSVYQDQQGFIWIGTISGLNRLDPQTNTITQIHHQPENPQSLSSERIQAIYQDSTGILWIGGNNGLDQFNDATQTATHYLQQEAILSIYQDKTGFLWLATDGSGIYRFNPENQHYQQFQYDFRKPTSLSNAFVMALYGDQSGALWIGTWGGGINKFDPAMKPFGHYPYQPYHTQGLSAPAIFEVHEDAQEDVIWIGTEGGGLNRFDRKTGIFTHYYHDDHHPNSLLNNNVYMIAQDEAGTLWIATWEGLSHFDPVKEQFTNYSTIEGNPNSLSGNEVNTIIQDRQGYLWLGTWYSGLNRFDPKTQTFTRYQYEETNPHSIGTNLIITVYEDRQGTLWVGTGNGGLNRFDPKTETFTRYLHNAENASSLSSDYITALYEDTQGRFWVGTNGGGFNLMDRATGQFRTYRQTDGLADNVVNRIVEDNEGHLWLGTFNGLSHFNPQTQKFRNYTPEDGLQGKEFYAGTHLRTGELIFGGRNGFNLFRPENIRDNTFVPPVVFTDFKLFNQSVQLNQQFPRKITFADAITLTDQDTVFSFEFAALNYLSPRQNRYAYRMEGFDRDWIEVDSTQRLVTYTNLNPGQYTFRVKGSNNDGVWNETGAAIKLTVLPPWWQTGWAYFIYFVVTIGSLIGLFAVQQHKLARTRAINGRLRQVDKLKDEFLANTSHELRTPLNGIIGLAESLIEGATGELSEKTKMNLAMIVTSGKRLATLVNDILDFSKLKHKTIELQLKPVGLREIVEVVLFLDRPLIGEKSLQLINAIADNLPPVQADENRLQQILHNLVGNAIKFTESGHVEIIARVHQSMIHVTVADTGIGIPKDQQERIFESFEQADGSTAREHGGTGLGLAVTKQLVELHKGQLWVTSQVGQGSQFTFTLPIATGESKIAVTPSQVFKASPTLTHEIISKPMSELGKSCCILAVDDEPINLQVLNNFLSLRAHCHIVQATSGVEAIKLIQEGLKPDIILLDVMMPKMSGYEVTQKIREMFTLSELPILLLTAKNRVEDLVTGLESGANDYLTKPFSKDELIARINTHLNVKRLKEENLRMQTELDVSRHLQQILLPRERELEQLHHLEVTGFMEPTEEVGGDYYDVLIHQNGVKIGIGDVTGHGLESGILAMMVQTAVRTLLTHGETDAVKFLATINRTIYDNVQRMEIDRNLTLCLLDWQENRLRISGQHEEVLIVRHNQVERLDTADLGFLIGLEPNVASFTSEIELHSGDIVILYTDGVTEAENEAGDFYGLDRLCTVVSQCWQRQTSEIKQIIIDDLYQFIGKKRLRDDVTLVVLKQR